MAKEDSVLLLFVQYRIPISASSYKPCMALLDLSLFILETEKVLGEYTSSLLGWSMDYVYCVLYVFIDCVVLPHLMGLFLFSEAGAIFFSLVWTWLCKEVPPVM